MFSHQVRFVVADSVFIQHEVSPLPILHLRERSTNIGVFVSLALVCQLLTDPI